MIKTGTESPLDAVLRVTYMPLTITEICEATGLTRTKVTAALGVLRKDGRIQSDPFHSTKKMHWRIR